MQSKPELVWDKIITTLETWDQALTQSIDQAPKRRHENQEYWRRVFDAIILAVNELRQHPQLKDNPPMKSHATLRWFPHKRYEVNVYYDVPKLRYGVSISKRMLTDDADDFTEQTIVYLSKVADTVVAFIEKAKQLPAE